MSEPLLALPTNPAAERFLLGAALIDPDVMNELRPIVIEGDYSTERHRRIYRRMVQVYDSGNPVTYITVATALKDAGELEADGLSYLISLTDGVPQGVGVAGEIGALRDDATRRRIIELGQHLINRASNRDQPQAILDEITARAVDLAPIEAGRGLVSARELIDKVGISEILAPRIERGIQFPASWPWMNRNTCGMLGGELWVLAAHTSCGKTSAAIQTAIAVAQHGTGAAVFSLEMGNVSILQRAVWQLSGVDSERAKKGRLTKEERERAAVALAAIYELPIHFSDGSQSVMEIHAAVRQRRSRSPVGFIVVDYLQLLRDGGRFDNRSQAVGANARALKLMASEFSAPVLLLSQFNRESAKPGKTRKPDLTDLKESGDIENHANGVWFIHRENMVDADRIPVEFILAKQREGRRNIDWPFVFEPAIQRFTQQEGHPETERSE